MSIGSFYYGMWTDYSLHQTCQEGTGGVDMVIFKDKNASSHYEGPFKIFFFLQQFIKR